MRVKMDEAGLNYRLAEKLYGMGLDATGEADAGFGKRIDILVNIVGSGNNNIRIALEMEKFGPNKKSEAIKDAASRLNLDQPNAELAIAMIYPKSCQSGDDITPDTTMSYLHVTSKDIKKYSRNGSHDYVRHAKRSKWGKIRVRDIPVFVSNLHKEVGAPEILAEDLGKRLDSAVMGISIDDMKKLATSLTFNYEGDGRSKKIKESNAKNGAKRALLVVAGAALFHTQLGHLHHRKPDGHTGTWPPMTLDQCRNSRQPRQDLMDAWKLILLVDYRPIFESAITVLEACSGAPFKKAITSMIKWASIASDDIAGLRHDVLGRIFHRVLDTAKQDGSYYTSTPAAAFLAALAVPPTQNMKDFRVLDPACGTGTLLMAVSERLREIMGAKFNPTTLIDEVIHGVDINTTACHMAATSLGLLSPETNFDEMNIFAAEFGLDKHGRYQAGSLEFYGNDGLNPWIDWSKAPGSHVETGQNVGRSWRGRFSLIIMNPPFTRNSLRHDQFTKKDEKGLKDKEGYLFRNAPKGLRHSSDPMFMLLAERLAGKTATVAVIRPMSTASSSGSKEIRKFLARHFHIEVIVVSFDPNRIWFSENTNVNELLLVLKRPKSKKEAPTKIVKLAVNPSTEAEAIRYANSIHKKEPINHCTVEEWDQKYMGVGDWSTTQFYSRHIADLFMRIRDGDLFRATSMGNVAEEGVVPQGIRMLFQKSDRPPPLRKQSWDLAYKMDTQNIGNHIHACCP